MTEHLIYKHPACLDVGFFIRKKFYIKEKSSWSLRVEWVRCYRDGRVRSLNITQRLTLSRSKFAEFVIFK